MPNPNILEREALRLFEVRRPALITNADGSTEPTEYMETLTIEAQTWSDAEVQAKAMNGAVVAEVIKNK